MATRSRTHADLKLEDSPAQRHIIKRPRLTKLLDEANARIILLIGPAGYGKTTLAREWTAQRGRRGLWYRARKGASDVALAARVLSQALAPLSSTIERSTRQLLSALNTPEEEPEEIANLLADELNEWPIGTWLVIDEYELVAPHEAPVKLLERFVELSGAKVLITSRERPSWVTPRDLLYGDAFELQASALSMTLQEGSKVLNNGTNAPAGLVALADGWPAVIGLAALLPGEVNPTSDVQSGLFDYVAQELFNQLDVDVQRHLVLLSVPATLSPALVQAVSGDDAESVLRQSIRTGLMTARDGADFEIHPLCRTFLERKLWDVGLGNEQINALATSLIEASQWDDAFEVIRRFGLAERLPLLIDRGLRDVLGEGRLAAVETWLTWADEQKLESAELMVARAEIYFRRSNWELAETLATTGARMLTSSALAAQAYLCAGAAAHFLDEVDRAWSHYEDALKRETSPHVRRRALWGRFVGSYWAKRPGYRQALADFEDAADPSPEYSLRLSQARIVVAVREGGLTDALQRAMAAEPLLQHIEDPVIRGGFLHHVAYALATASRYVEAKRVATQALHEAERFRLSFARASNLITLAVAKAGLGSYTAATADIERAHRVDTTHDSLLRIERHIVLACISLARGNPPSAAAEMANVPLDGARQEIVGEALATRALAEACSGDKRAPATLAEAKRLASEVRSWVLIACADAILESPSKGVLPQAKLDELANTVTRTGCFDSLICALRASPKLLEASIQNSAMHTVLRDAAIRSQDSALSAVVGVPVAARTPSDLSRREREVLQLVAEGFHNAEIGDRLFISPKTVKTHLQNIYEKLDVNTRTEAALKARDAGLLR